MPVHTELILARHGEAICNVSGRVGGPHTCTGLTDRGRDQVVQLVRRLAGESPIDVLYTSPRTRTQQTAAIVASALNVTAHTDPDLRGLDHGAADGHLWTTVKTRFGGRPQRYPSVPLAAGAESWNAYLARTGAVLQRLLDRHSGSRLLIAAHGETIEAAFAWFSVQPVSDQETPGVLTNHACLTRWQHHINRFGHAVWMLASHNDTQHRTPATASPAA